jgi:hypothetical protein
VQTLRDGSVVYPITVALAEMVPVEQSCASIRYVNHILSQMFESRTIALSLLIVFLPQRLRLAFGENSVLYRNKYVLLVNVYMDAEGNI